MTLIIMIITHKINGNNNNNISNNNEDNDSNVNDKNNNNNNESEEGLFIAARRVNGDYEQHLGMIESERI